MGIFDNDAEVMALLSEKPDYQDFIGFLFQSPDSLPELLESEQILHDPLYLSWSLHRRGDFWAFMGAMYFWNKRIIITEKFSQDLSKAALDKRWLEQDFDEAISPMTNMNTDEEKYEYLLRKKYELEGFWERCGHKVGSRGHDDYILTYINKEVEYYERKFRVLSGTSPGSVHPETTLRKRDLTIEQVALIYYYRGEIVTEENGGVLVAEHGYKAKTSGRKLYQHYCYYSKLANRKGIPPNPTRLKIKNKIDRFEGIIPYLNELQIKRLNEELEPLKIKLETDDW